jgi:NAD(P)H-hydrate epimerase
MARALGIRRTTSLKADAIIDALFGIGLNRDVTGRAAELIERMNASRRPIVAVDIPSGLDGDSGRPRRIAVRARVTVTMGWPKIGFRAREAKQYVGRLVVADIGYPRELK